MLKEKGTHYQFPHLPFWNISQGIHLAYCLLEDPKSYEKADAIKFVSFNKYKEMQQLTFSFIMQDAAQRGILALDEMFAILDQNHAMFSAFSIFSLRRDFGFDSKRWFNALSGEVS